MSETTWVTVSAAVFAVSCLWLRARARRSHIERTRAGGGPRWHRQIAGERYLHQLVCWHEAAHVVAAAALGFRLDDAVAHAPHDTDIDAKAGVQQIRRPSAVGFVTVEKARLILCCAGRAGELAHSGQTTDGVWADYQAATKIAVTLAATRTRPISRSTGGWIRWAERQAEQLVRRHVGLVERVAAQLENGQPHPAAELLRHAGWRQHAYTLDRPARRHPPGEPLLASGM